MKTIRTIILLTIGLWLTSPASAQPKSIPGGGEHTLQSGSVATNLWLPLTRNHYWYTVSAYNAGSSDIYLMLFDTNTTNVANGSVPSIEVVRVPTSSTGGWSEPAGVRFRSGLLVVPSTTPFTLTNAGFVLQGRVSYYPN